MSRRVFLCLPLLLAASSVCLAGIPTSKFTITVKGISSTYLAVRGGDLALGNTTGGTRLADEDTTAEWFVDGTRIKARGGKYLAYDPTGKSDRICLVDRPGEGTDWSVSVPGRAEEEQRAVIRAASGAAKGRYLSLESGRPVLSREPSEKLHLQRIWIHK